jgi:hypothetical protein
MINRRMAEPDQAASFTNRARKIAGCGKRDARDNRVAQMLAGRLKTLHINIEEAPLALLWPTIWSGDRTHLLSGGSFAIVALSGQPSARLRVNWAML